MNSLRIELIFLSSSISAACIITFPFPSSDYFMMSDNQ